MSRRTETLIILGILLAALALRVGWHWQAPHGWREDELSNALVVSQHVLEGDVRLYYDDASGHEGLYHWLQAGTMALFGPGVAGIRGVSIACGVLSVWLLYLLAREMFNSRVAIISALALAVSFWGLMYSRSGQRHVIVVVTTLATMYFLWRGLRVFFPFDTGENRIIESLEQLFNPHKPRFARFSSPLQGGGGVPSAGWGVGGGSPDGVFYSRPRDMGNSKPPQGGRGDSSTKLGDGVSSHGAMSLDFALAGLCLGVGFYTYFASRGVPLILLTLVIYFAIWQRDVLRQAWRGLLAMALIAGLLGLPLFLILRTNPDAEARVSELAAPIEAAGEGDFSLIGEFGVQTLSMFTHDGDPEVLYNVPNRPVFSPVGGALFWGGAMWAAVQALGKRDGRCALLLLWLFAGLAPGALSTPPASLGHTILAQPVVMVMPALAIDALWTHRRRMAVALAVVFLGWEAARGPYDYFLVWPDDSFNRVLHHSDLHEAAALLNAEPEEVNDVVIGSYLLEQWDQQATLVDLDASRDWRVRAFDPRSAMLYPAGDEARWVLPAYLRGGWAETFLSDTLEPFLYYRDVIPLAETGQTDFAPAEFDNDLVLIALSEISEEGGVITVITTWEVGDSLILPERPLFSKPPAPGQDDTPRLAIFVQLLDEAGRRVTGWDGLSVDPYTLYPGDRFLQRHDISMQDVSSGEYTLVVGLYNPMTGVRHLDTITGNDHVVLTTLEVETP